MARSVRPLWQCGQRKASLLIEVISMMLITSTNKLSSDSSFSLAVRPESQSSIRSSSCFESKTSSGSSCTFAARALARRPDRGHALCCRLCIVCRVDGREHGFGLVAGREKRAASCHRSAARLKTSCGSMTRCSSSLWPRATNGDGLSVSDAVTYGAPLAESLSPFRPWGQSKQRMHAVTFLL